MSNVSFMNRPRLNVREIAYKYMGYSGKTYVNKNKPDCIVWTPERLQELCSYIRSITSLRSDVWGSK